MQPEKRRILLIVGSVLLFLGILALLIYALGPGQKKTIEIFVVPTDSKVTIDGQPVAAGEIRLRSGTYTFSASRQYFESVTKKINLDDLGPGKKIVYLALYPNSPEGQAYLDSHPDELALYERVAGAEFSALQSKILEQYPVTRELPHQTLDYKIDYDITKDREIVFLITFYPPLALGAGSEPYKEFLLYQKKQALDYLKDNGVNTSKVKITYSPDPDK